jgi:hypothetical protein
MRMNEKHRLFLKVREKTGINIASQILREWFACEMGKLGISDRYVAQNPSVEEFQETF